MCFHNGLCLLLRCSCLVLSCVVLCCVMLSCVVLCCLVLSCLVLSCCAMHVATLYHSLSYQAFLILFRIKFSFVSSSLSYQASIILFPSMNVFRSLIPQLARQKEELVNAEKIRSPPPPPCLPYRCLPLLPPSLPWSTFHASTKCLYPLNLPWSLPKRRPLLKEEAFALRCPALPHLGANNTLFDALLAREGHRVRARTTFLTEAWRTYEGVMAVALCPFFLSCILSPRDKEK